ncbi:MAG: zinc-dependent alcohol dehydrogenase [Spirochaetia bacterium]
MKALFWKGGDDFEIGRVEKPVPGNNQVLVRMNHAVICGSDFHLADFGAVPPVIPGHEGAGIIEETGPGTDSDRIGQRVALNPVQVCGVCSSCSGGIPHLCLETRHLGEPGSPGCWAEYVAIDAVNAVPVPPAVSMENAALSEPCAVCYESFLRYSGGNLEAVRGKNILIIGDGPFGFLHAMLGTALKAGRILVLGHHDARLDRIREHTKAESLNTSQKKPADFIKKVLPEGVDLVIEATGSGHTPDMGIKYLKPRGTLIIFSYIWNPEPVNMGLIHMKELNVLGSCRSLESFHPVLKLMGEEKIEPAVMLDGIFPLHKAESAFLKLSNERDTVFKCGFHFDNV